MKKTPTIKSVVSILVLLGMLLIPLGCGEKAEKPTVTGISPNSGTPGSVVQVFGSKFGDAQGESVVHVGEKVAEVLSWSDTVIAIKIPQGLAATTQGISVLTQAGESNEFDFRVELPKPEQEPRRSEGQIENPTPLSAMLAFLKKEGIVPSGWTFSIVKLSSLDPNWKIDDARKPDGKILYFLLKNVQGNWSVVDYGQTFTPDEMKSDGAPNDLQVNLPPPQPVPPQPESQYQVIIDFLKSKGMQTTGLSIYEFRVSRIDPSWELLYGDFPPEVQQSDLIFAMHMENNQWVVKNYGSGTSVYQTPGLPDDLKQ